MVTQDEVLTTLYLSKHATYYEVMYKLDLVDICSLYEAVLFETATTQSQIKNTQRGR